MAIRRFLVSGALSLGLTIGVTASAPTLAAASPTWCEDDPLVTIVTPDGATVRLYVTNYAQLPVQAAAAEAVRQALKDATISVSTKSIGESDNTHVLLRILIPTAGDRVFTTRSVVSTAPNGTGRVLARARGRAGAHETLSFHLDLE